MMQFEMNDSYQGFASAMPPEEQNSTPLKPLFFAVGSR
jgi:hypothetical protein